MLKKLSGLVANIQRYSLNDGPGIRTTVFMKGCFLRCRWCHNVEMISNHNEVWYSPVACNCCGKCIEVCEPSAIKGYKDERTIDRSVCTSEGCFRCVEVCTNGAMTAVGKWMSVKEVVDEIQKDSVFYRHGGGGVSLSGGEPLMQAEFATEVLKECQAAGIHTVLDTCGYASWGILDSIANYCDLILLDIKHMNSAKHKFGTGVSNELILENARKLATRVKIRIRIPVIPGFNDSDEELRDIALFIKSNGLEDVDLLPYHPFASAKYRMYLSAYEYSGMKPPSDEQMECFKTIFEKQGMRVAIGG